MRSSRSRRLPLYKMTNGQIVVRGPLWDISGYGAFIRYVVRAMFQAGMAPRVSDISSTLFSNYKPNSENERMLLENCTKPALTNEELVNSVVINAVPATISNRCHRYNIIYTMTEADRISPWWVECCNAMDSVWVPGPFNKESFETAGTKRVKMVYPGFDTDAYRIMDERECVKHVWERLDKAPDFNFIVLGHLFHTDQDRKGIKQLIRCFARVFEGDPNVGLVLKTQLVNHTVFDQMGLMMELKDFLKGVGHPEAINNITVVHGNYTTTEIASLYNHPKIKCFVSPTMGEGIALNMLEASACGLPVMASLWSEHLNFLSDFIGIPCEIKPVPDEYSARDDMVYVKEARWAHVDDGVLQDCQVNFVDAPDKRRARDYSYMSLASFGERIKKAIDDDLSAGFMPREAPKKVQIACGPYPVREYFHIDIDPVNTAQVDMVADAKNLMLDPDSVDEVLIIHFLEHLQDWEIYRVLFEAWKILRMGGTLKVSVPDFDVAVKLFKERKKLDSPAVLTRAIKTVLGSKDPHVNLFDFERLRDFLESVGFEDVRRSDETDIYDKIAGLSIGSDVRVSLCVLATKGCLPGRK